MNSYELLILGLLKEVAGQNPTVQIVEEVIPALTGALAAAHAGQAFSVSVPPFETPLNGTKGHFAISVSWTPDA